MALSEEMRTLFAVLAAMPFADSAEQWPTEYASVGTALHPASTERLMEYWAHGKGAAKIDWPAPCSFCRCLTEAGKYFPKDPKGLCANLHHRATGQWPNAQHSRVHHCPC